MNKTTVAYMFAVFLIMEIACAPIYLAANNQLRENRFNPQALGLVDHTDWGQFHGNYTHNGVSSSPGPKSAELLWMQTYSASSTDTIEEENGILIFNSMSGNELLALNESTGHTIFQFQIPVGSIGTVYAPAGGGNIYFEDYSCGLSCSINLGADALSTGDNVWNSGVPGGSLSPVFGYDVEAYMDGYVIRAPYGSKILYAYNFQNGNQLWSLNLTNAVDEIPAGGDGIVVVASYNNLTAVSLTGKLLWTYAAPSNITDTPSYAGGAFYFGTATGELYKISPQGHVLWNVSLGVSPVINTPSIAFGEVFIGLATGTIYALNETTGKIVWQYTDSNPITCSPAVSGNHILYEADSAGNLIALNTTNGKLIWTYTTSGVVYASPVLDNGYLFVVDNKGDVYAFGQVTPVTFTENGLPPGATWYVNLSNGQSSSSTTNTITFYLPNGNYEYDVNTSATSYAATPESGAFTVNSTPVAISITFKLVTYQVTFTESGLPTGDSWYVNLSNGQSASTTSNTLTFNMPDGTYTYNVGTAEKDYRPTTPSGSFTVNGQPVTLNIQFTQVLYSVVVGESGLPPGTEWIITVNGRSYASFNQQITLNLPDGTYQISVDNLSNYYTLNSTFNVVVNGANLSMEVVFLHYSYLAGSVSPSTATVDVNGSPITTNSGAFNLTLPAGTYNLYVSAPGYNNYTKVVTLSPGQSVVLNIVLQPLIPPIITTPTASSPIITTPTSSTHGTSTPNIINIPIQLLVIILAVIVVVVAVFRVSRR